VLEVAETSFAYGSVVPIPTLPVEVILTRSSPFVEAVMIFAPVADRARVPAFVSVEPENIAEVRVPVEGTYDRAVAELLTLAVWLLPDPATKTGKWVVAEVSSVALIVFEGPADPVKPVEPMFPVEPVKPVAPSAPIDPVKPVFPLDPVKPWIPWLPTNPVVPCGPWEPEKPWIPWLPAKPVAPRDPVKPLNVVNNTSVKNFAILFFSLCGF